MDYLFKDQAKIKIFAEIQSHLNELEENSEDEAIDNIINLIPPNFLSQKKELMVICQLFSYYSRIVPAKKKKNTIKLYNKLMDPIKRQLQDQSSFFWNIFGGLYYFKLWMYREGLISIEFIIVSALTDTSNKTAEYFLPEIIEREPELFENELKAQFHIEYTQESIQNFKELRELHFKWLQESGDFHDPIYQKIEKNRLRLALKTDDIDTFQKILAETNMSVNAKIYESALENFLRYPNEISLIELAIEFNSVNIFKFLIMNDAEFDNQMNFIAIKGRNYEIIHLLESKKFDDFDFESSISSISCWNDEMKEYITSNYDFSFLEKSEVTGKDIKVAIRMMDQIFFSSDFMFLDSVMLPFLQLNPNFIEKNFYEIVFKTFSDNSGFFLSEFLKYPNIDINYRARDTSETFLFKAINERNTNALEIVLNFLNEKSLKLDPSLYCAFIYAAKADTDIKIVKLLCDCPGVFVDSALNSFLVISILSKNPFLIQYVLKKFSCKDIDFFGILYLCFDNERFYSLKLLLKTYLDENKNVSFDKIIEKIEIIKTDFKNKDKFIEKLKKIYIELNSS